MKKFYLLMASMLIIISSCKKSETEPTTSANTQNAASSKKTLKVEVTASPVIPFGIHYSPSENSTTWEWSEACYNGSFAKEIEASKDSIITIFVISGDIKKAAGFKINIYEGNNLIAQKYKACTSLDMEYTVK